MNELARRAALITLYSDPVRSYHTTEHVYTCLRTLGRFQLSDWEKLCLTEAIWWHDAVYDPMAKKGHNETESLKLWLSTVDGYDKDVKFLVGGLIMKTIEHKQILSQEWIEVLNAEYRKVIQEKPRCLASEFEHLAPIFLDIDLAILGTSQSEYARYMKQVRAEYPSVPEHAYNFGRKAVLQSFLAREKIFLTEEMSFSEEVARSNLTQELQVLT